MPTYNLKRIQKLLSDLVFGCMLNFLSSMGSVLVVIIIFFFNEKEDCSDIIRNQMYLLIRSAGNAWVSKRHCKS